MDGGVCLKIDKNLLHVHFMHAPDALRLASVPAVFL